MIALIVTLLIATAPSLLSAAGLVPCDGPDCNICDITTLMNNVITWLIGFGSIIAVIAIVHAGIKLVTSGGNQSAVESAKSMAFNVVIGFIILLCAWLIVNLFMMALTKKGGLKEWQIKCATPPSLNASPTGSSRF